MHDHGVAAFAHRRLAIIDLDTGEQPMTDGGGNWITTTARSTTTSSCAASSAGTASRRPRTPRSSSRAYRQWGDGLLERLRGMFAFALWDERPAELLLRPRPIRDQAALLHGRRRRALLRVRGEGAAAVPAGDRDRPRRAPRTTSRFQFCLGRQDAVQGGPRAAARPLPARSQRRASRRERYWEVYYEPDFDHTAELLRASTSGAARRVGRAASARRRAGRRLRQRRTRLEHRRRRSPRRRTARG